MYARKLRILGGGTHHGVHALRQFCRTTFAAILQIKLEATGVAEPKNGWRTERQHQCLLDATGLHEKIPHHLLAGDAALVPVLLGDKQGGGTVLVTATEEIKTGECDHILVVGVRFRRLDYFFDHCIGAVQRCTIRQEHGGDVEALILVRHQGAGRKFQQTSRYQNHAAEQQYADGAALDQPQYTRSVMIGNA